MTGAGDELFDRVAAIWAEALELDRVEPDADFLAIGGHSLAAIRITAQVRELVDADVPLELIFERVDLADYVAGLAERT